MSTKYSIAHGDNFHIYEDLYDEEPRPMHVEIYTVKEVESYTHRDGGGLGVTMTVPAEIWKEIVEQLRRTT